MIKKINILIFSSLIFLLASGCNPFAPKLEENRNPLASAGLGDQKTVDGVFQNFRYSYLYKDTIVYGRLLADDFVFSYINYDRDDKPDLSWGRTVDMMTTYNLFQAAQNLDLMWDDILMNIESQSGDTTLKDITRGFLLNIVFQPTDILRLHGKAIFRLRRIGSDSEWKIISWRDESNE